MRDFFSFFVAIRSPNTLLTICSNYPALMILKTHSEIIKCIRNAYTSSITKAYVFFRFKIISIDILDLMDRLLPSEGRILDVGCGFGLFASYLHLRNPKRIICGFDLSEKRVLEATSMAQSLGISEEVSYSCRDVCNFEGSDIKWDAIYCLDLLHHIKPQTRLRLLHIFSQILRPGGVLIIKDVSNQPLTKAAFTWLMDQLVSGPCRVWYRSKAEQREELESLGFSVETKDLHDSLPYPHIVLRCTTSDDH
ncbi:MAG: class I SAM-dependent methyltransferase [Candidatus Omnitrophica bacterium]|nr:class I SAM-dependent methyltransferase [Candidatus Omnitrophota bacterium]